MTDLLIADLGVDGRVSVSLWPDDEPPPTGLRTTTLELSWPLDGDVLEDLRWYLEDYLRAPFGVYSDRGARIAAQLHSWGEALFGALFASGSARDAYARLRERDTSAEVVLRSSSPAFLGLPWELLADPARPTPLALDGLGVVRSLPTGQLPAAFVTSSERLRVLMVISRPQGPDDVAYRMVARPLLERLDAVRGRVDLVVLRPPSLQALDELLRRARAEGQPFHVVHFDGHGMLAERGRVAGEQGVPPFHYHGAELEGVLVFEKPDGGSDDVSAAAFARVLKAAEVPVVVLNACQSGAMGTALEAAVATRLLQEGAASVVAMGYAVFAVAAAEFMAAFYERLFAGETVSEAVGAGRCRLHERPERPSPKGMLPLADWLVPVHYVRREVRFPHLRTKTPPQPSFDAALDRLRDASGEQSGAGLDPIGTFVGRDGLFYELELAARLQGAVVLHGPGGTGKTELAKAFGRWWRETNGVESPHWVVLHSFEPGVASFGLDGVVANIGLRVFGTDFARLDRSDRRRAVEQILVERRLLLIWDNFETVAAMPDPARATPPLKEAEQQELRRFVASLAGRGASSVLITSRTDEAWLGDLRRIPVGGLASHEAIEYAEQLLRSVPASKQRREKREFGELLEWLDGHPLSMRLVLPHLEKTEPEGLLDCLQGTGKLPEGAGEGERTNSLPASVTYSYQHLMPDTRRLLVAVCLFHGIANVDVLATFSQAQDTPERFRGASKDNWLRALDDAACVGLLTAIGDGMYRIHPTLPSYVAAQWRSEDPDRYDDQRDLSRNALLSAHAEIGRRLTGQGASTDPFWALSAISNQRRTFGHFLDYALKAARWEEARVLAEALEVYWHARGLNEEADSWAERGLIALEERNTTRSALDTAAGSLWLFFVGCRARRQLIGRQLDDAEKTYLEILNLLQQQPESNPPNDWLAITYHQLGVVAQERKELDDAETWYRRALRIQEEMDDRPGIAGTYHHLGMVAQHRGRLDQAEDWYQRSLAIKEEVRDHPGMSITYHQLGVLAQHRGLLDQAEDWYQRSLAIEEELHDRPNLARTYHQLGMVAQDRGDLDSAESWYQGSLAIEEELHDRPNLARTYHHLGMVAQNRRQLGDADDWYRRSLAIKEELGDRRGLASTCHQLGTLAQDRGELDDAENWYRRSLAIKEELGDHPGLGSAYHHLGVVAQHRGRFDQAEDWYRRSLAIKNEVGNLPGLANTYGQLGLLYEQLGRLEEAMERTVRCVALFDEFPHPLTRLGAAHLARLTKALGFDQLEAIWSRVTGQPLPRAVAAFASRYEPGAISDG